MEFNESGLVTRKKLPCEQWVSEQSGPGKDMTIPANSPRTGCRTCSPARARNTDTDRGERRLILRAENCSKLLLSAERSCEREMPL